VDRGNSREKFSTPPGAKPRGQYDASLRGKAEKSLRKEEN